MRGLFQRIREYFNTEDHDELVSLSFGRYDDLRMVWTGRPERPRVYAITDTSQEVAEVNEDRIWISLQNLDAANEIWLNFGAGNAAAANSCMRLDPGAMLILDRWMPWRQVINAACSAGETANLGVNEVWQSDVRGGRGA